MAHYTLDEIKGHEFEAAGAKLIEGAKAGLYEAARDILALSLEYCPEDTGVLRRSARVDDSNLNQGARAGGMFLPVSMQSPYAVVGYGYGAEVNPKTQRIASDYAVPVHERAELKHEPPTQSHFLQTAVEEYATIFGTVVGEMMADIESVSGPSLLTSFLDWEELVARRDGMGGV